MNKETFTALIINLPQGHGETIQIDSPVRYLGGSGLAAALYEKYGLPESPADHPDQPLIFAIGPLTGFFPLMSKVVLGFKSPYHEQYAETHAGGRLALAMRFAQYDAIVIRGAAKSPSSLVIGAHKLELVDVHYLWGQDVLTTGKLLRKVHKSQSGHRSIMRIGPAGENGVSYAGINVDTYRHFGRLGAGAIMGSKKLKAIVAHGERSMDLPGGKTYKDLYRSIYKTMTESTAMRKYHDLGTPQNVLPLNELKALPWRNMQATGDPGAPEISGEKFARDLLLRKTACAGCPVGCIHVGLLREQFGEEHEFNYKQVSYDHEPIFSAGSMLGVTRATDVLALLEEMERQGLDVMSAGVCLAWATEALKKGILSEKETIELLDFNYTEGYQKAIRRLGAQTNEFYRILGQGVQAAANHYGGEDFACALGQEMAGYATGEVFFVSQAYGFRHSHLDTAGYSFDQSNHEIDRKIAVDYLLEEERQRVGLTCMVACLFARKVYEEDLVRECLSSLGYEDLAQGLPEISRSVQIARWKLKFATGYDPAKITIPKRFSEITTWKGPIDGELMDGLAQTYREAIQDLCNSGDC
jgi:aldehyde:ferredoxin oxidoreductase